jgi:hypothetical protein
MGPRPGGVTLDPLVGLEDPRKPLRSRILAVPALRARYLDHVRTIAQQSLEWRKLGPVVAQYRSLMESEVKADTRKLSSFEAFRAAVSDQPEAGNRPEGPRSSLGLRAFADQRVRYLLNHPAIKEAAPPAAKPAELRKETNP